MQTLPGKSILKAEGLAGTKAPGCKRPGISRNKKAHSDENEQEEEKVAVGPLVNQSEGPGFPWAGRAAQPQPTLRAAPREPRSESRTPGGPRRELPLAAVHGLKGRPVTRPSKQSA